MAMEFTAYVRRLAQTGFLLLIGMFSLCGVTMAQQPVVTPGSIIPLAHSTGYCQIFKIINAPNGDTVLLDICGGTGQSGALYQLKKGSTTFNTITTAIDSAGEFWNEGMAMDAQGTLYITDRYSNSQHIFRVPYNPADGTWDYSAAGDNWYPSLDAGFNGNGTLSVAFLDSAARDGSGLLFVSEQNADTIIIVPVNAGGTISNFTSGPHAGQPLYQTLVSNLTSEAEPMDVDVNGNLYFIESPYVQASDRTTGIFFVPPSSYQSCMAASAAGGTDSSGNSLADDPCIAGTESSIARIDPGNTEKFNGITHDAAGNIYVGDTNDSDGGTRNGLLMIPNTSGSPVGVTAASFNFGAAQYLSSVNVDSNPAIDYRGFFWLPTGTSALYTPAGSGGIPGTGNFVLYQLGSANLGATPVGTPSATGTVFYTFSGSVTPTGFGGSQPGGVTQFSSVATNPYPPATGTTPAVPCTAGVAYIAFSSCEYWVALTPQGTSSVGSISGQLSMLNGKAVVAGSTTYLNGIGQGPAAELLIPSQQTPLSSAGLVSPQQVAGDSLGNSYVADPGQKEVLMFPAGSTTATVGTPVGTGLTAPTGVAVDGSGDVYIADSGKVIELASVNGVLSATGQTVASGLGGSLNLAVDGADNVYVADPNNARVVRIFNSQESMVLEGTNTVGTGFTAPSAVAVDNSGDLFVADGANLVEINAYGGQTTITSSLAAPVTGLAVDPSGSVYVAQSGGVLRIPMQSGSLDANDAATIDAGGVTAPSGIGIDSLDNLYVTAASYSVSSVGSSGTISTPVSTPNVLLLNGALVNFGIVSQLTQSNPTDVNVYNVGNEPLALKGSPTFSDPTDYGVETDGQNPCDLTGTTTIASAAACQIGVAVTATALGVSQASMTVTTDAINAPSLNAALEAYSSDNLCQTQTAIALTPATGLSYPGSTSITSTTTPVSTTCSPGNLPQGGNVVLTLSPQAPGAAQSTQTAVLTSSGTYTFNLSGLSGGTYVIYVRYTGDAIFGGSSSSRTFSTVVAQATPTVTLATPAGITAINGIYYVGAGTTATLAASVTSSVGTPTGSVSFMNGSALADPAQGPVTLDASGAATFSTTNLAAGTSTANLGALYNVTAVYSGDANFASVSSTPVSIEVIPPVALITASPASITTPAGTAVTSTLSVQALNNYQAQKGVELYCDSTTLPQYSECTFDVPSPDLYDAAGKPVISHVTITSNLAVNLTSRVRTGVSPIAFAGMFGLGLLGLTFRKRLKFNGVALGLVCMTMFAGSLIGLTGCTNSGYTRTPPSPVNTTPSGTYQVSIYTIDLQTNQKSSLPFTLSVTIQ